MATRPHYKELYEAEKQKVDDLQAEIISLNIDIAKLRHGIFRRIWEKIEGWFKYGN